MKVLSGSYLRVQYELRPAKQVERRMIVDALQLLARGFAIRRYQYTGMGSIYFVDFLLFHKLLGLEKLVCVELDSRIKRRVEFNRPFGLVNVTMGRIGDYIGQLSRDEQHLLWLDYDEPLSSNVIQDVALAGTLLSAGSIVLITVDVEPPKKSDGSPGTPGVWFEVFEAMAGALMEPTWNEATFKRSRLPWVNAQLIHRAILSGMAGRQPLRFLPMFFFEYADGHRMITVGGMVGGTRERRKIGASGLRDAAYFRGALTGEPYRIHVPKLTRKERLFLDSAMPCASGWSPKEFELDDGDVSAYRDIYRFFPAYAELLLG